MLNFKLEVLELNVHATLKNTQISTSRTVTVLLIPNQTRIYSILFDWMLGFFISMLSMLLEGLPGCHYNQIFAAVKFLSEIFILFRNIFFRFLGGSLG